MFSPLHHALGRQRGVHEKRDEASYSVFLVLLSWKYSWACQGGCPGLIFMGNKADVQPPQLIAPVFSAATQKRGQG